MNRHSAIIHTVSDQKEAVTRHLTQVKKNFTGVTWIVEGDIKACFDNFDHHVLVELLRKRISDEAFIGLIWKFLKARYMEQWQYNCTYSGVPQGSGISPICANIYLSELDSYMQNIKKSMTASQKPERRPKNTSGRPGDIKRHVKR